MSTKLRQLQLRAGGADVIMERSDVFFWHEYFFVNQAPVTVQSAWNFTAPDTNDWSGQSLAFWPEDMYTLGIWLTDPDAATASAFGFPAPGLQIIQFTGTRLSLDPNEWATSVESYPITPEDVTGQIIFETVYSEGVYRHRFSLDGGTTFLSPFSDLEAGPASHIGLGADPTRLIPEPSTALLLAGGLAGLAAARRRRSIH